MPHNRRMNIADIKVGKRFRKDMGDIAGLGANITSDVGLLQPIVVRRKGQRWELVAGERRLAAAKRAGEKTVEVVVRDMDDATALRAQFAENAYRKDFTLSEAVAIKRALEPLEKAAAKQRQREHGKTAPGRKQSGQVARSDKGRAADKVAKVAGMARRTLEKAAAVVDAAEAEPRKYNKLLEKMDHTGRVNGVFRQLKIAKQAEVIRAEPPPLPGRGPYRVIVCDLPWPYMQRADDPSHRAVPYPTMSIQQMCDLDIKSIAHRDCILWLWTTNLHMLQSCPRVLEAWGFKPITILTWAKDRMGCGDWLRGQTEHAILAMRGKPTITLSNQTTLLTAPTRGHSAKPVEFYNLVESLCPAPRYADLFSRYKHNDKWDTHGDESPCFNGIPRRRRIEAA